jgi:hypothetical protein
VGYLGIFGNRFIEFAQSNWTWSISGNPGGTTNMQLTSAGLNLTTGQYSGNGGGLTNLTITGLLTNNTTGNANGATNYYGGTLAQSVIPSLPVSTITNTTTYTAVASTGVTIVTNIVVTAGVTNIAYTFSASGGGGGLTNALNVPLAYYGGTNISVVLNTNCAQLSYSFIATNNFYLVQPTNMTPGFSFGVDALQDATGGRLMTVNTNYWYPVNGQAIQVNTNPLARTLISCWVSYYGTNISYNVSSY